MPDLAGLPFHAHSYSDPASRVRVGDGEVYRIASAAAAPRLRGLFEDGLVADLVRRGLLVESAIVDPNGRNGGPLVVRHRRIEPLTYPHEWPYALLCAAAATLLETARAATAFGRTIADGHPWNLVADPELRRPLFVDLGSFWPIAEGAWRAESEFLRFTLHPLGLMASGQRSLARLLLAEEDGVGAESLRALARGLRSRAPDVARREQFAGLHRATLERLARRIESLRDRVAAAGVSRVRDGEALVAPARAVIESSGARRIVDLGGPLEATAPALAAWGLPVVALGRDEAAADRLWERAERERLPLLPLVVDPFRPTPPRGVLDYWQIAATDRLRGGAVVALGIAQAAAGRRLLPEHAAEAVAQFAPRVAVVAAGESDDGAMARALARRFARVEGIAGPGSARLLVAHDPRPRSWASTAD